MSFDKEEAVEVMNDLCDIGIETAPKLARVFRAQYDALVAEGFSKDEALKIATSLKPMQVTGG